MKLSANCRQVPAALALRASQIVEYRRRLWVADTDAERTTLRRDIISVADSLRARRRALGRARVPPGEVDASLSVAPAVTVTTPSARSVLPVSRADRRRALAQTVVRAAI